MLNPTPYYACKAARARNLLEEAKKEREGEKSAPPSRPVSKSRVALDSPHVLLHACRPRQRAGIVSGPGCRFCFSIHSSIIVAKAAFSKAVPPAAPCADMSAQHQQLLMPYDEYSTA
ncbi:hypothetical protein J3458_001014 [Metarhizium acridum]|uniref:uncharacterized protein n=1 Tax=Metarhizium acridum TaxID=92637 RepID=UPI001C6AF222|nr:hypothetical protein J3458_001014 [Metarhizium acridum]